MNYHIYVYLREDGTPYYVGKGKSKWRWRAKQTHNVPVPPQERVKVLYENLTNDEACAIERQLIAEYGRKDNGTGILRNLTEGGEGAAGRVVSEEQKQKQREKMRGRKPAPMTEELKEAISDRMRGNTHTLGKQWKRSEYTIYCPELKREWESARICYEELGITKQKFYNLIYRNKTWEGLTFELRRDTENVGKRFKD